MKLPQSLLFCLALCGSRITACLRHCLRAAQFVYFNAPHRCHCLHSEEREREREKERKKQRVCRCCATQTFHTLLPSLSLSPSLSPSPPSLSSPYCHTHTHKPPLPLGASTAWPAVAAAAVLSCLFTTDSGVFVYIGAIAKLPSRSPSLFPPLSLFLFS